LRIAIGIATAGRRSVIAQVIPALESQTRLPDAVVICAPGIADVGDIDSRRLHLELLFGCHGSCVQRNRIIDRSDADVLIFMDDDFVPREDYILEIERLFSSFPDVVMSTGFVIADGILGPGLTIDDARRAIMDDTTAGRDADLEDVHNGYGCNMAVRLAAVQENAIYFDEELPLYGWLEDVDFSRRLARHGRIVKSHRTRGVHLGVKQGRQAGVRVGYSQIANPVYLAWKGTMSWPRALRQLGRNVAANCVKSVLPEPYVDRRGRLLGHLIAVLDLATGKIHPRRVLHL
jgi:glycosyltransferase involved in cell wall biosynthesis